jgi:hypothetical protein
MANSPFLENTPVAIAASLAIVGLLTWRLKPSAFRAMSWQSFGISASLFWGIFAAVIISFAWNFYYQHFVPDWYRFAAPIGALTLYSLLGLFFRWGSVRLPGNPTLWFCILGGLESVPEHAVGIYRFDILEVPVLAGSSAASIFIFAFFEYVFYWGVVLALAIGVDRLLQFAGRKSSKEPDLPQGASD